ncbi:MAG: hypothetical protein VW421_00740 [Gammaproteobacteria bacterium]
MDSNRNINVHLGMIRCGSTTIQKALTRAEHLGAIKYLGFRPGPIETWYRSNLEADLIEKVIRFYHPVHFDRWLDNNVHLLISDDDLRDIWLSNENFSGSCVWRENSVSTKIERIGRIFQGYQIKFDIVIRKFDDFARSLFFGYNKIGQVCDEYSFLTYIRRVRETGIIFQLFPSYLHQLSREAGYDVTFFLTPLDYIESIAKKISCDKEILYTAPENVSESIVCLKSSKTIWSGIDKHRYLWSERNTISDEDFFSERKNLIYGHTKEPLSSDFISKFRDIFLYDIDEEKKYLSEQGLDHISKFLFD